MHHDFIMRQIQLISLSLGQMIGKAPFVQEISDPYRNEASNELYQLLMNLLADGRINEAENLLFDAVEKGEIEEDDAFNLAFDFYLKVNGYNDEYLELCNFSRAEADMGWADITKLCGVM